jgi:hypothetical protein
MAPIVLVSVPLVMTAAPMVSLIVHVNRVVSTVAIVILRLVLLLRQSRP